MDYTDRKHHRAAGFSLIELLVTLVVLGIITAITIGVVLGAHEKAKQGATVADMRSIATAIETYAVDVGYPPATVADFTQMEALLEPYHTSVVPVRDHWGHLYGYEGVGDDYTLVSFGKDGVDGLDVSPATRNDFERDIVYSNGRFVAAP